MVVQNNSGAGLTSPKNEVICLAHKDLHGITMKNIYRSLFLVLVGATQKELARQIRYLKVENEVLRSKLPYRVPITNQERNRLVRFGAQLGRAIDHLVSIVHPSTLRGWIREDRRGKRKVPVARGRRPHLGANASVDRQAGPRDRLGLHAYPRRAEEVGNLLCFAKHGQERSP